MYADGIMVSKLILPPAKLDFYRLVGRSELQYKASFIYDVVQSAAAGHVHQNSSAHVVRRGHLDAAAVLAHGSPQRPIGRRHR